MPTLHAVPRHLLTTSIACAVLIGGLTALPSSANGPGHADQGTATLPSPVGFGVTDTAFLSSCPDPGPSQGLDGWVFALPAGLAGGTATIVGTEDADIAAYVYDGTCGYLRSETDEAAALSFTVASTDKYLSVYATDLPEVTFDLTVTPGVIVDPTVTPTATATATPTPTPTPTQTPGTLRGRYVYPETPNDPLFVEAPLIAGQLSAGSGQWGMQLVQAPQAWLEPRATGAGVQVAVLDTGLDLGHPDLACQGKVRVPAGATPNGTPPQDLDGHGTHVAGIIGACTNNGTGVVGVAPDATLLPYRVLGTAAEAVDLATAIRAATDAGAHVINMSIGVGIIPGGVATIPGSGSAFALIGAFAADMDPAIAYAVSKGVVVVAAAGNETSPICGYPALADGVVCVGSTDRRDLPSFFSNFALKADGGVPTDGAALVAPGGSGQLFCDLSGENILSTFDRGLDTCDEGTGPAGYRGLDGTSMASPHVAGAAALVYDRLGAVRSPANAARVKQALADSAVDLGVPGFDPQFGSGRLDVLAAVRSVTAVDPDPTPTRRGTSLVLTANAAAQRTDSLPVTVLLKDEAGAPVAAASVRVTLAEQTVNLTTGPDGTAATSFTVDTEPGQIDLSASYAGTPALRPSGDHQPLQVLREDTALSASVAGKTGKQTVSALLTDADNAVTGVAGVSLVLVDDKGAQTVAVTDAQGRASWEPRGGENSKSYEVRFAGDSRWVPSSATT